MKEFSFKDKHVLITGAGGGLGSVLTRKISYMGCRLVYSDRSIDIISDLKPALSNRSDATPIQADLSIPGEAETLASKAMRILGDIHILINNAGIGYHALLEEAGEERVRAVYEVNAFSPMALILAVLPGMKRAGFGMFVNILSCAGFIPTPTTGIYGASKAAFAVMSRTLRMEVAPFGVKVFNFYPGPIATPFNENAFKENNRVGLYACGSKGADPEFIATKILGALGGKSGEIWLDNTSRWLAMTGTIWPKWSDRRLRPIRDAVVLDQKDRDSGEKRRWRLWQVETSIACNLDCIMCPWKQERSNKLKAGDMPAEVWTALRPYLSQTKSIDFTGGGEPLLHPKLTEWIQEAHKAGCETGFLTNGVILDGHIIRQLLGTGLDWIGFSVDGATADIYEQIRKGAEFQGVLDNIGTLCESRAGKKPFVLINFVIMKENAHQLEDIVRLADRLGVNQINFKQCDVVRGEHGRGYGLFASKETRAIRRLKKRLRKARRLAQKLGIKTTAFSFIPDELPVCAQDPRDSLFIRYDGKVAPCISLANGGRTDFLQKKALMPTVHYGALLKDDLISLWQSAICEFYIQRFEQRAKAYDQVIAGSSFEPSLIKLNEVLEAARNAMPAPPEGCKICHYLYDI